MNIYKYIMTMIGKKASGKGSNGCPNKGTGTYVKCVFINSANIVVTVSNYQQCCPTLTHRGYYASWARIN